MYFIIRTSEDGISFEGVPDSKIDAVLTEMANEEWGGDTVFLDAVPPDKSPEYWGSSTLIIKGAVVVPRPVSVITKYTID